MSYDAPPRMATFGLRQRPIPRSRIASCAEVECPQHVHGWRSLISRADPMFAERVLYIRNDSGRHFTETELPDGSVWFDFPAEQECFAEHHADVATFYVVRDWRQDPTGVPWRKHSGPDPWVDECATNQDLLAAAERARG